MTRPAAIPASVSYAYREGTDPLNIHTSEYRENGLVHRLNLLVLQHITGEQGDDEEHKEDEQRP